MNASKLHIMTKLLLTVTLISTQTTDYSTELNIYLLFILKRSMYFLVAELLIQLQKNKQTGPCKMD